MGARVVLIGPPGSGKSAVGRALAAELGVDYVDTDAQVEATAGKSISDIFIDDGEPRFREMEADAVAAALRGSAAIVSLGGGAPMAERTQRELEAFVAEGGMVAYLAVSAGVAVQRTGMSGARPLLLGNPRQQWIALMQARRPIYERLATLEVSTDALTPHEVAMVIREATP